MTRIVRATAKNIHELVPLFEAYRIFYKQSPNEAGARAFLEQLITNDQSVVFLAYSGDKAIGFTQLFTSYSSVSMQPLFILNDLYVDAQFRKQGVGELLLNAAKELCKELNYKGLALETATDNPAQQLYERLGWKKDVHCYHYFWTATE